MDVQLTVGREWGATLNGIDFCNVITRGRGVVTCDYDPPLRARYVALSRNYGRV